MKMTILKGKNSCYTMRELYVPFFHFYVTIFFDVTGAEKILQNFSLKF